MAGKKAATPKDPQVNHSQGVRLLERLDAAKLELLAHRLWPQNRVHRRSGTAIRMNCPLPTHGETTPSFDIDAGEHIIKCYGCNYVTRNLLQFLSDTKGWSFRESISQIHSITGVRLVPDRVEKSLEALDVHQQALITIYEVANGYMTACLARREQADTEGDFTEAAMRAVEPALRWLFDERKHLIAYAANAPYGILPSPEMLRRMADELLSIKSSRLYAAEVTTFDKAKRAAIMERIVKLTEHLDTSWTNAALFITGYGLTTPGRIRLRRFPYTSKNECMTILDGFADNDDPVGFFGLYSPNHSTMLPADANSRFFLGVEGENDALTVAEHLAARGVGGITVYAFCGNGNETDLLAEAGVRRTFIVSDEPGALGDGKKFIYGRLTSAIQVDVRIFSRWEGLPNAKDPDDAIHLHGFDRFYELVCSGAAFRHNYQTAEQWALEGALDQASTVPEDDTRGRVAAAVEYGRCVRNPIALALYVESASTALKLPAGPLRQEIVKAKDTERGFIARTVETIRSEFLPLYHEPNAKGGTLHLHHKRTRREITFHMVDGDAMAAQFANVFGNLYDWFKDSVGLPASFTEADEVPHAALILERVRTLQGYLRLAMQDVYQGVPARSECKELGQGLHVKPDPELDSVPCLYVVNGKNVYYGRFLSPGRDHVTWEELSGPRHGAYLFLLADEPWAREITGVGDLDYSNTITKEEYAKALSMAERVFGHWRFKHQSLDASYLARHLAAMTVPSVFPAKTLLSLNGLSHTGKSTLLGTFCGKGSRRLQILDCAQVLSSFSAANIYQGWNHKTCALCMDEFEASQDQRSHKGAAVENITEMLRDLVQEGGAVVGRGSSDGKTKRYVLDIFVVMAAINRPSQPQDENRRYEIHTHKAKDDEAETKNPAVTVFQTFTHEEFDWMRRVLNLGLYRHIANMQEIRAKVEAAMTEEEFGDFSVPTRFLNNFIPLSTVMELLGQDWRPYVKACTASRKERLLSMAKDTAPNALYARVLSIPGINLGADGRVSVRGCLAKPDGWRVINSSSTGVFFDAGRNLLVIDWTVVKAPGGLLHRAEGVENVRETGLKHTLDQHELAVPSSEYQAQGIRIFLRANGHDCTEGFMSVLRMSSVIEELRGVIPPDKPGVYAAPSSPNAPLRAIQGGSGPDKGGGSGNL